MTNQAADDISDWFVYVFHCRDCNEEFGTMYADTERCFGCETIWQEHMRHELPVPCRCYPSRCTHEVP